MTAPWTPDDPWLPPDAPWMPDDEEDEDEPWEPPYPPPSEYHLYQRDADDE